MLQVGKVHNEVTLPMKLLSLVRLLVIQWTVAYQAPLSMGFSRQEYWSGLPLEGISSKSISLISPFCDTEAGPYKYFSFVK